MGWTDPMGYTKKAPPTTMDELVQRHTFDFAVEGSEVFLRCIECGAWLPILTPDDLMDIETSHWEAERLKLGLSDG